MWEVLHLVAQVQLPVAQGGVLGGAQEWWYPALLSFMSLLLPRVNRGASADREEGRKELELHVFLSE